MKLPILIQKINPQLALLEANLIIRKPLFLIKFLARSLRAKLGFKNPPLKSVLFHTHYKCNLSCAHCYERNFNRTNEKKLTFEEKKQALQECLKLGALSIDFVGGESSLDPQLTELIKACSPWKTYISLATNGYHLDESLLRSLYAAGLDKINISLDSWFAEEHDQLRGKRGVHDSVFKTISLCKKIGLNFHLTIFVYKNYTASEGFKKIIEFSLQNQIRTTFKLAVPVGKWEGKEDYLITSEDREKLFTLTKNHPFLVRTCIPGPKSACPAIRNLITITAYGDILPCNVMHISFGNLRKMSIEDIIAKSKKVNYFKSKFHGCPPAEDKFFIENYITKTYDADPYPVAAEKIFKELSEDKS